MQVNVIINLGSWENSVPQDQSLEARCWADFDIWPSHLDIFLNYASFGGKMVRFQKDGPVDRMEFAPLYAPYGGIGAY